MPITTESEEAWETLLTVMGEVLAHSLKKPEADRLLEALDEFPNEAFPEFELDILTVLQGSAEDALKDDATSWIVSMEEDTKAALFGLVTKLVSEKLLPTLKKGDVVTDRVMEFSLDILEIVAKESSDDNAMDMAEQVDEYFAPLA